MLYKLLVMIGLLLLLAACGEREKMPEKQAAAKTLLVPSTVAEQAYFPPDRVPRRNQNIDISQP